MLTHFYSFAGRGGLLIASVFFFTTNDGHAQSADSIKLDYRKIYAACLDADVASALKLLEISDAKTSVRDAKFKTDFEARFKYDTDRSDFLIKKKSDIDELLSVYHEYWRSSLLNPDQNYDSILTVKIGGILSRAYRLSLNTIINTDSLGFYLNKYVKSKGLYTTGWGKTGKLFDLLVWRVEKDTTYSFKLNKEKLTARVFMMDNFVTLGWEEYATFGRAFPGGWATREALFCVQKSYNLKSENFNISYLAHEGRHFADYKIFPKLSSADLEYRGKLTELSMARTSLYTLIESFIRNANYDSQNGHSIANFCAIRELSRSIFKQEFQKDMAEWKKISVEKINKTANEILKANTRALQRAGNDIEKFIKPQ